VTRIRRLVCRALKGVRRARSWVRWGEKPARVWLDPDFTIRAYFHEHGCHIRGELPRRYGESAVKLMGGAPRSAETCEIAQQVSVRCASRSRDWWPRPLARDGGASGARCQFVSLFSGHDRVEHCVLGFDDRGSRVIDRKRRVVFGVVGAPLGSI
jgi:hypothetical protein